MSSPLNARTGGYAGRPRPGASLEGLHARVESIAIAKVWLATNFAKVLLHSSSAPPEVDCRASDAITLALNATCPIQVSEEVMENSEHYRQETEPSSHVVADASAILKGVEASGSEAEMKEHLEVRRAFVRHINGLVTRRGKKKGKPG